MANKKKYSFEIRSPLDIAHSCGKAVADPLSLTRSQSHTEQSGTLLKQHSFRHTNQMKHNLQNMNLFSITTIQRLLKYDLGINDTFQKLDVGTQ